MKHKKTWLALALLASTVATGTAQAALFDRGGGMIYDSTQNITWAADANLFATQFAGNANLVSDIIIANSGFVTETPDHYSNGVHHLVVSDFHTGGPNTVGSMTWWGAQAWANSLVYGGFSDWRLPTTPTTTDWQNSLQGYYQTDSEMGQLFHNELGGLAFNSIVTNHNANYYLFNNIQASSNGGDVYYTSIESPGYAFGVQGYNFGVGYEQTGGPKDGIGYYAWAVRTGDVAAVPVPAAIWLFGTGLMGLTGLAFKRKVA